MKRYPFQPFSSVLLSLLLLLLTAACNNDEPCDIKDLPSHFVVLDDSIQIHYRVWGEDRPKTVTFVHGFGCDMNAWEAQFDAFRDDPDLRMIFVDLPGYGQSAKPRVDYTLNLFSRSVLAVLDEEKCSYTFLVGHSLGTPVCRQALFMNPDRVAGLCDVDGVYCLYPVLAEDHTQEEADAATAYEASVQQFASSFDGEDCRETIAGFVQSLMGPGTPASILEYAQNCMPETPQYVASSTMHNLVDRQWWPSFPIPFPAEIICTQNSGLEPDNRERMRTLYPSMQYTELTTCGHFIQMEQPEVVNGCLRRLFDTAIRNNEECFDFAIRELEQNYAGFPWLITEERRPEYEQIKKEYRDSISMGAMYAPAAISEICCYMQDFHLACSYRRWSNRFPMKWAAYDKEMTEYNPQPVACKVDDQTFLFRFPTCCGDEEYVRWTWDAIEQYRRSGCDHLIVDIRGNGGGNDDQFYPILQLLYAQPGRTDGVVMRNTADNRERRLQYGPEDEWLRSTMDSAAAHADDPWFSITDEYILHEEDGVDPYRPKRTAIIIDHFVASSGEQLLLNVRSVAPDVKFYGRDNTLGCLDFSNCESVPLPHFPNRLQLPTTVSRRVLKGEKLIDGNGIEPDVRIELPLPDTLSDNVDEWVLWVAEDLKK